MEMPTQAGGPAAQVSKAVMTYWIDKKSSIDLKLTTFMDMEMMGQPVQSRQTMIKKDLKIDQPVPDSLFAFTPPPDAREVKELFGFALAKADLAGQDAPAFDVKDLDAKPYSLASLKGKP